MRTIHKFMLRITGVQEIELPRDARVLSLQMQRDIPCLWAEVDDMADQERVVVRMYGTGFELGPTGRYLGTVQFPDTTVWHFYGTTQ